MTGRPEVQDFMDDEVLYRRAPHELCFDGERPPLWLSSTKMIFKIPLVRILQSTEAGLVRLDVQFAKRLCGKDQQQFQVARFTVRDLRAFNGHPSVNGYNVTLETPNLR